MASNNGYQQSILWDEVHVLIVNYSRREMYLYENAGGEPGVFHIRTSEAGARANIGDPFDILDMAIRYTVRFELLARVLDAEVARVFEAIGVKDFLNQIVTNTTEEMRRNRFNGLNFFQFTVNPSTSVTSPVAAPDDDESEDEDEVAEVASTTPTGRTRRRSGSS